MTIRGELKKALWDWRHWLEKYSHYVLPRASKLRLHTDLCLAFIGVRRSGKSSLTVQLASQLEKIDRTFYFNFEDPLFFLGLLLR